MEEGYHQVPIIPFGGRNLEEKEGRHDLDKRLVEDKNARNQGAKGNNEAKP